MYLPVFYNLFFSCTFYTNAISSRQIGLV